MLRDWREGVLCIVLALHRSAQVRHQDDLRTGSPRRLNRWQRRTDTGIAGHHALFDRHIEILANQNAFAAQVLVPH